MCISNFLYSLKLKSDKTNNAEPNIIMYITINTIFNYIIDMILCHYHTHMTYIFIIYMNTNSHSLN